jgi:hypothetical protein
MLFWELGRDNIIHWYHMTTTFPTSSTKTILFPQSAASGIRACGLSCTLSFRNIFLSITEAKNVPGYQYAWFLIQWLGFWIRKWHHQWVPYEVTWVSSNFFSPRVSKMLLMNIISLASSEQASNSASAEDNIAL